MKKIMSILYKNITKQSQFIKLKKLKILNNKEQKKEILKEKEIK